ncbi:MAG: RNA polymerase subunit sigma-70 [Lachnospiraceae bacterium]|nr:RNA polymerase subunit sigma-70 [Lachnospiraceae bacterium]
MDKKVLSEYIDACELIRETEEDIKKLNKKKRTIIQTNVKGSNPDFPYEEKHFHIEGMAFSYNDDSMLRYEEKILEERKANAERIKTKVEAVINSSPVRIQRIIKMKYFEGLSWQQVSDRLGRRSTAESARKELDNFLKEK